MSNSVGKWRPVDEIGQQVLLIGCMKPSSPKEERCIADEMSMALDKLLHKAQLSDDVL